jgi:archaellum component FlaC
MGRARAKVASSSPVMVMAGNVDNLVLEHLRHSRGKVDQIDDRMSSVEPRLGSVEVRLRSVEQILAGRYVTEANQNVELDRLRHRVDRIERRLELTDG